MSGSTEAARKSADALAGLLEKHEFLFRGLVASRRLGPAGADVAASVLEDRELQVLALSWELWICLTQRDGVDIDALLEQRVDGELVILAKDALGLLPGC